MQRDDWDYTVLGAFTAKIEDKEKNDMTKDENQEIRLVMIVKKTKMKKK